MADGGGVVSTTASKELVELLRDSADEIIGQWASSLKSGRVAYYADRPLDELESTARQCLDGYVAAIGESDHSKIRRFIHREVRARVGLGLRASEIAQEFCIFEAVAWPLITERYIDRPWALASALSRVRNCVDQALFEFSDMYQLAAQQQVEQYLSEMEAMNRRLEELSVRDALTGLYNRRYFHDRLTHEFRRASRHDRPLALLMLDIDHFKQVNDTYGHQAGDQVLRSIALLLVNQTRGTDITARYGGEEFAAVLPETDREGAVRVAEKLRESVAVAPLHRPEPSGAYNDVEAIFRTVSIGVAVMEGQAFEESALLIRAADSALYAAKHQGRNRVIGAWDLPPEALL